MDFNDRTSQRKLITSVFLKMMINSTAFMVTVTICALIDNIFTGRILGKDALAAAGFFSPVITIGYFCYIIILGTQILTGNLVGECKTKDVNRLFMTSFLTLAVIYALLSCYCLVFTNNLAHLLGARDEAYTLLCDYIKGYAPGIVPQILASMLMAFCSFNNDLKRSYVSLGTLIAVNFLGDVLLIKPLGIFGIALASTLSSVASFLVLLPGFCKKGKLFHFQIKDGLDFKLLGKAAFRGLPSLLLAGGSFIKNTCFNFSLNQYVGAGGVAVAGIMASAASLLGAISTGCFNSYSSLAGIYIGEEDKESLIDLTKTALKYGLLFCTIASVLTMILSTPLSRLFVPHDPAVQLLAKRMFILNFTFLIPNVFYNIFLQAYRAQNRMHLVNVMSFAETTMIGLFTLFAVKQFGSDAAWISNTLIDIVCIFILYISVIFYRRKIDFSYPAMLKLPETFGANDKEFLAFSIKTIEEVEA